MKRFKNLAISPVVMGSNPSDNNMCGVLSIYPDIISPVDIKPQIGFITKSRLILTAAKKFFLTFQFCSESSFTYIEGILSPFS